MMRTIIDIMKQKWTKQDKFDFSTKKLRAKTIPSKKKLLSKQACKDFFKKYRNDPSSYWWYLPYK
jgi:hypothetical protein